MFIGYSFALVSGGCNNVESACGLARSLPVSCGFCCIFRPAFGLDTGLF